MTETQTQDFGDVANQDAEAPATKTGNREDRLVAEG